MAEEINGAVRLASPRVVSLATSGKAILLADLTVLLLRHP